MTIDYIKNIIDAYLYKLQSINSYDVGLYEEEHSRALKQFTESFDALNHIHPELIQVNMPDIVGDEDAEHFKQVLEENAARRYSIDILPTGNYYHDKIMGEDIYTPNYIRWHDENSSKQNLVINYSDKDEKKATYLLNNILLNSLLSLPIGKVNFTFVDINYTGMTGLFTENLVSRYYHDDIIDSPDKFRDRVRLLTEHMSAVMKKYGNAVSYNNKNRFIVMPYEVVVLNCYPKRYDGYIDDLLPLFENGPKYGVFFIVLNNKDYSLRKEQQQNLLDLNNFQIVPLPERIDNTKGRVRFTPICKNNQLLKVCWEYLNNGEQKVHNSKTSSCTISPKHPVNKDLVEVPIGAYETEMTFKLGSSTHIHSFIIGTSGSGKSVLLHDILLGAIYTYSPKDLQLYLIDCKLGTEFIVYKDVKHVRALAINCDDIGTILQILIDLENQLKERAELFNSCNAGEIDVYNRKHPESKLSQIWMVIDECQVLFAAENKNYKIGHEIVRILENVSKQGRSFGIHLVLSTQTLAGANIPTGILGQVTDRYILKSEERDANIFCDNCYKEVSQLRPGQVYYHHIYSKETDITFKTIFRDREEEIPKLIAQINDQNASYDSNGGLFFNGKSIFEIDQEVSDKVSDSPKKELKGCLGKQIDLRQKPVIIKLSKKDHENILLVGVDNKEQTTRTTIGLLTTLVTCNIRNDLGVKFYIIDCLDNEEANYKTSLKHLDKEGLVIHVEEEQRGVVLKKLAEDIKNGNNTPFVLVIIGQHRFRELRDNKEISNKIQRGLFGTSRVNFKGFRGARINSETDNSWTYLTALNYILEKGPECHGHTILQVDNVTHLLFGERFSKKELDDLFYHQIILHSAENVTRAFELPQDLNPVNFSSDPYNLRALYVADGGTDGQILFSPFVLPDESLIQNLTNK